uniref:Uncharacterized protein n=1 Tax=Caenorhabditis japonica TaxID=281687 RepID=A0A8R1I979_CAEJA
MQNTFQSPQHSRASPNTSGPQCQTTPKSSGRVRRQQRKAQSMSPQSQSAFASSSICSSPSARNVPKPPTEWLNQLIVPCSSTAASSRPSSSTSNASSSAYSILSSNSFPSSPSPSPIEMKQEKHFEHVEMAGVRVCPLQLIAAIASA